MNNETLIPKSTVLQAINSEPEYPDEMTDDEFKRLTASKAGLTAAFRMAVRETKKGIRERVEVAKVDTKHPEIYLKELMDSYTDGQSFITDDYGKMYINQDIVLGIVSQLLTHHKPVDWEELRKRFYAEFAYEIKSPRNVYYELNAQDGELVFDWFKKELSTPEGEKPTDKR